MRDLFDIFPDLPTLPRRPLDERLAEVRARVAVMRERAKANAVKQKRAAVKAVATRGRRK